MYYNIGEAKKHAIMLTKVSLKDLGISDSKTKYLKEVCDTDVDNLHNCLNIWLGMYQDITGYDASILKGYIEQRTIVRVVREAKDLRLAFIQSKFDYSIFPAGTPWFIFSHRFAGLLPVEGVLQILGFPKRLHFTQANLSELALDKFRETNKEFSEYKLESQPGVTNLGRDLSHGNAKVVEFIDGKPQVKCISNNWDYSNWHFHPLSCRNSTSRRTDCISLDIDFTDHTKLRILAMMKHEYAKITLKDVSRDNLSNTFELPPGSTYERKLKDATYLNKYKDLSACRAWIHQFLDVPENYLIRNNECKVKYVGRLMCVPKDISNFRTVMPEEVARQFVGYAYTIANLRSLKHEKQPYAMLYNKVCEQFNIHDELATVENLRFGAIDVTNQDRNRLAALIGSVTDQLATMDLSSASDTISIELCKRIMPKPEFDLLMAIRAKHIEIGDKTIKSNIMFTMGFSTTFITECKIYTAAARVAVKLSWPFAPDSSKLFFKTINRALASCFSFGDDVILPSFAADAYRMVCENLGFKLNVEKSYSEGPYRESCGKEYYYGKDITVDYYPRGTSSTRLAELISLQHKLHTLPVTNAFIIEKCGQYRSKLTTNLIGSPYMDIWSSLEPRVYHNTPYSTGKWRVTTMYGTYTLESKTAYTTSYTDPSTGEKVPEKVLTTWYYRGKEVEINSHTSLTGIPYWTVRRPITSGVVKIPDHDLLLDKNHVRFKLELISCNNVDEEEYCQVTVPQVQYTSGNTSGNDADNLERLAYVMRLNEMLRRPAMNSDKYLAFMLDRDTTQPAETNRYGNEHGIITHSNLRKSLSAHSSIKLVRRVVLK